MTLSSWPGETDPIRVVVDNLAERLGRSVVVNDPLVRQTYGSRHYDDEDQVRVHAVLQHDAGADVVAHVLGQGVAQWPRPGRLAGAPELGLLPRWCAPLRAQGTFFGTLMVIDAHNDLSDPELAAIEDAAAAITTHLSAYALGTNALRARREETLRGLFSADRGERDRSATGLREFDFPISPHLVVTIADVVSPKHIDAQVELALRSAQNTIESSVRIPGIGAVTNRRAEFLQRWITEPTPDTLRAHARQIEQSVRHALGVDARCHVGISAPTAATSDLRNTYRQAEVALCAARQLPKLAGVGIWTELGEYAPLLCIPHDVPTNSPGAHALAAIRKHDAGARLVATLRAYLDEAGSAPRAARALNLHRTSLYYRLNQIQEITGMNLDSGPNRLTLHLQLRLDEITYS